MEHGEQQIIRTGNEFVASAEATTGVFGVGRVKDQQQAWIGGDERSGNSLAAELTISGRRRYVLAAQVGTQVTVAATNTGR